MSNSRFPFKIGDLAVPAHGDVGPTYIVVDFTEYSVTVAWRGLDGHTYEETLPHDAVEIA